jgi:hypothetical protein
MSQPSDGNTNPAPATPPFFLTEGVSDLAMTYFYGHLFVARVSLGSVRNMSWSKYGEFLAFAVVLIVIPGPGAGLGWLLVLAWSHAILSLAYLLVLITGLHGARRLLMRRRVRRALDATTGAVLLGFGARLATEPV